MCVVYLGNPYRFMWDVAHCWCRCVPELLLENVAHYLVAAKRFEVAGIVVEQLEHMSSILTYLLVFMSGSGRARNPHLRAHLAECLECLVPQEKANSSLGIFCREQLFKTHPLRTHVSTTQMYYIIELANYYRTLYKIISVLI